MLKSIVVAFWESIVIIKWRFERKWRFEPWGENLPVAERGPLANTKKNLRNDVESGCGWVY